MTNVLLKPFAITTAIMGSVFIGADAIHPQMVNAIDKDEYSNSYAQALPSFQPDLSNKQNESMFINSLTLVNEPLQSVLTLLERWTQKIIIVGNNLPKATFSLNIPMPLSQEEAIAVLKSLLSANGIGVTPVNDKTLKIIPINRAKSNSPEIVTRESLVSRSGSQEVCCCLFRLNNLTAREAARIVMPWLTPLSSSSVVLDKANSLFITDVLSNLQQLDKILKNIDKVGNVQESILFFTPKNTSAESLKQNFEDLQKGALKCYLLGNTSFAADKSTNLFTVVTPKGNEPLIRQFVEKLDTNIDPLVQHYVFRIQHGSAKDTTELVKKLMQQQKQHANSVGANNTVNSNTDGFSQNLSIECDERLNAIVAYGTPSDIRQIQHLVDQLDVILPQVRIEVVIAEVSLVKGQASGLESFSYSNFNGGDNSVPTKQNNIGIGGALTVGGSSIFSINRLNFRKFGMDTVFNTAKTDSNVSILSSPTLLTTHAREALLKITETRPYLSSIQTKLESSSADISNQTIEKVDAGIELTVKPLIGTDGMLQLEIDQKVDSFGTQTKIGNTSLPCINRRQAKSFISVQSGEMIVLAGLKKRELTDSKKKMFLVGDIPLIGDALFTSKGKEERVTEMIIFIRPVLLKNSEEVEKDFSGYKNNLSVGTQEEVNAYLKDGSFSKRDIFETKKRRHVKRPQLHGKRLRIRQNLKEVK